MNAGSDNAEVRFEDRTRPALPQDLPRGDVRVCGADDCRASRRRRWWLL